MIYDVAIIDYGMSNLQSVMVACKKVGLSTIITKNPNIINSSKSAILPGVGAFGSAMQHLKKNELIDPIKNFINTGKPFIGICLGLQLLFEESEEFGFNQGLGIIKGKVKKFKFYCDKKYKYSVPQIGWNKIIEDDNLWNETLLGGNDSEQFMYFVHSYYVEPEDKSVQLATTTYGKKTYCSAINYKNIFATQFHPEKSGKDGLKIYSMLKKKINNENTI